MEHKDLLFIIISNYFNDTTNIPEWEWGNLRVLPKSKNLSSPHNWRGINLLDTASKIISMTITKKLQTALTKDGFDFQFGSTPGRGCPDAKITMKTILLLRRELDHDSYVVFADLVKDFDTINLRLILELLKKYGILNNVVRVVEKLYMDFKMQ